VDILFRMLFALGIVLLIMWAMARFARKQYATKPDAVLSVLARQPLGRTSAVAVIKVMDKAFVVGVTDQGINLLGDTDLNEIELALAIDEKPEKTVRSIFSAASRSGADTDALDLTVDGPAKVSFKGSGSGKKNALDGSALSPATWKQLVNAAREATVRK
jgi:flagellar protein FliO/FliZ